MRPEISTEKAILHDYINMLVRKAAMTCGVSEDKAATAMWLALMANAVDIDEMVGAEIKEESK